MSNMNTIYGADHLERSQVWSTQLKEAFDDDVVAQTWVNWLTGFPDGAQFNISSIGEMPVDDYEEGKPLPNRRPDTGQFQFTINNTVGNKAAYTDEFMEDDFLAPQVVNATPTKMKEALDRDLETKILNLHSNQTAGNNNAINTKAHRYAASGSSNVIALEDVAYAKLALRKAHVPLTNLVGVVTPEFAYELETLTNLVNVSDNPRWEGVISEGMTDSTGIRFLKNIYGFDIYESNYLSDVDSETVNQKDQTTSVTADGFTANLFFSALGGDASPFVGAWRREPRIVSWRDEEIRTEFYELTARYGLDLYRPENLVTVLANDSV